MRGVSRNEWLSILFLSASCASAQLRPPEDLTRDSDVFVAHERQHWGKDRESFTLGELRVSEVRREPASTSGYVILGFGDRRVTSSYHYTFGAGSQRIEGSCAQVQDGTHATFRGKLACRCAQASFEVEIGQAAERGVLYLGDRSQRVTALREQSSGGRSEAPLGYRFDAEQPTAAIELGEVARVWLRRAVPSGQRDLLLCLAAGLLLYRPVAPAQGTRPAS